MTEQHGIEFDEGAILWQVARTYPTLHLTLLEMVQNALDAGATRIYVGIDQYKRRVVVLDNGRGVTVEHFKKALGSVGRGIKKKGSLGQFGRGLVAPISLCHEMSFLSRPEDTSTVHEWTFIGEKLRRQAKNLSVPYRGLKAFPVLREPFAHAAKEMREPQERLTWRTMVLLEEVTADSTVKAVEIDDLAHAIRTKFGTVMQKLEANVYIKLRGDDLKVAKRRVDPTTYTGEPLDVVTYRDKSCGEVTFTLYTARKQAGKRQGTVVIRRTDDHYPVTVREAQPQAMGARVLALEEVKQAFDTLGGGYFEGEITVQNITLHPDRTKFELDDALKDLYFLLGEWYLEVGQQYLTDARTEQQEERYTQLGEESLARLMSQLENGALSSFASDLGEYLGRSRTSSSGQRRSSSSPRKQAEKDERQPVKVSPKPKTGSDTSTTGFLRFAYDTMPGSSRLWEYDTEERVLTFNIRHPLWVALDETDGKHTSRNDRQIMALQEWLAFKVLLGLARGIDDDDFEVYCLEIDHEAKPYISYFIAQMK